MNLKHGFLIALIALCLNAPFVVRCEDDEISADETSAEDTSEMEVNLQSIDEDDNKAPPQSTTTTTTRIQNSVETTNAYEQPRPQLQYIKTLTDRCLDRYCYNFNYNRLDEVAFFDIPPEVRINSNDDTYDIVNAYNYEALVFENSTFAHFPLHLFYSATIQELDMRNCSIELVTWECFLMAQNLRVLLLSDNRLRTIDESTFKFASDLQYLFLDANLIEQLHAKSFAGLNDLRYLDLSDNRLTQLPRSLFEQLNALQELHLNNNRLRILNDQLFLNNLNLKILKLGANRLQHIDQKILRRQTQLIILDLVGNVELRTLVLMLTKLHNLIASSCALTRVNIYGYVRNVDLSYNHILELYFAQPEDLETLNLRNNSLQQIASLTRASKLEMLDLGDNPALHTLPSPWQVNSLKRLDLGNTGLRALPIEAIAEQTQLIFLNVSYNKLREIHPENFKYLEHLSHFDIRGNDWNCYNLIILMDMLLKPFTIAYGYDRMDPEFPGEYINDIACMYRLEDDSDSGESSSNQQFEVTSANGFEKPAQLQASSDSEYDSLRRELKAIVNIYEQKFDHAYQMIDGLNRRLQAFERLNASLMQHVTITV
ncbi:leucine-rich repeat-containing G-protein coupled receptor 5 [Eurosta solidaginis]|uniref:leucine-rich repeat-containing G-protein coupled receptor 5 n=1 Tax=Eurosta solidaginis TaxID=178769 RepID=UPI0035307D38